LRRTRNQWAALSRYLTVTGSALAAVATNVRTRPTRILSEAGTNTVIGKNGAVPVLDTSLWSP
jgi:hypothetical protein